MIRLGHIDYSNCVPVHALLLDEPPADLTMVRAVPAQLNRALAAGLVDAAPCSSIEYARHPGAYRILPGHAIGACGAVHSILLESVVAPEALDGRTVAVPDASATSVVLLRALLELRLGVRPRLAWFDQGRAGEQVDPLAHGAAAVLRIGDVALRREPPPGRAILDLGAAWTEWTGLPFAFAVWHVRRDVGPAAVARLSALLQSSRAYFTTHSVALADRYAGTFGISADRLHAYWAALYFDLDGPMQDGLLHFYELAAELGEAPRTVGLDIIDAG
jgi:chorismate dehydratase